MFFLADGPAKALGLTPVAAYAALLILAGPAMARDAAGEVTQTIAVRHIDRQPQSPAAARKLLRKLGNAALEVCGASRFSLSQVQDAVRGSTCWRESMTRAVNEVDSPLVTELFTRSNDDLNG